MPDREPLLLGRINSDPSDSKEGDDFRKTGLLKFSMGSAYDFSKSINNLFTKQLKRQVTIGLDTLSVDYFKGTAAKLGMPYQNLINLYLRDCAVQKLRPEFRGPPVTEKVTEKQP